MMKNSVPNVINRKKGTDFEMIFETFKGEIINYYTTHMVSLYT